MLNKIKLFYQIKKFYKIYGEELGSDFIDDLSDITDDNLWSVQFDINEVLDAYKYCFYEKAYEIDGWLRKLDKDIQNFREGNNTNILKHSKSIIFTSVVALITTVGGYTIGKNHTIKSAELHNITSEGYDISYGDEVHNYTFEEVK